MTDRRLREHAFAKLNLTLDVLSRRPDGYHDMEMVMQSVSLCDDVDITVRDIKAKCAKAQNKTGSCAKQQNETGSYAKQQNETGSYAKQQNEIGSCAKPQNETGRCAKAPNETGPEIRVDTDKEDLPRDDRNLAGKAAGIFLEYTGISNVAVSVNITKRIPDRAGMAGGSSDAAAVIRGLDRLLETRLTERELLDLCLRVGSDVPFCLRGGTALARGRGEVLTDLPPLPECGVLIVKPEFSVSTPALFAELDRRGFVKSTYTAELLKRLSGNTPWEGLFGGSIALGNVFISALDGAGRGSFEGVRKALSDSGAALVNLTGTGSAVFGLYPTLREAAKPDLTALGETFAVTPVRKLEREY